MKIPKELEKRIDSVFADLQFTRELEESEIKDVAKYCEYFGGNRKYVSKVLRNRGMPLELGDKTFSKKCMICHALRNYCSC